MMSIGKIVSSFTCAAVLAVPAVAVGQQGGQTGSAGPRIETDVGEPEPVIQPPGYPEGEIVGRIQPAGEDPQEARANMLNEWSQLLDTREQILQQRYELLREREEYLLRREEALEAIVPQQGSLPEVNRPPVQGEPRQPQEKEEPMIGDEPEPMLRRPLEQRPPPGAGLPEGGEGPIGTP